MLRAEGIFKHFGGVAALSGARIHVAEHSITGLIGPNGAGKSTLFGVLSSFVPSDKGTVELLGEDVSRLAPQRLVHRGLVRTFQVPREFRGLTVLENLMTAPLNQDGERLIDVFFRAGAVKRLEEQNRQQAMDVLEFLRIDHLAAELASNLSGGQKKLLELGRALMTNPRLLLLDEPFAGVNPVLVDQIMERIAELRERGLTLLVIEHNIQAISDLSDTLFVMAEGQTLMDGPPQAVMNDPRVLEAYLGVSP